MPENTKLEPTRYPKSEQEGADEDHELGGHPQRGRDRDNEIKPSKTEDLREDELVETRDEDEGEVTSRQPRIGA